MSNVRRKVDLYMVSIGLLFAFLIVMTVKLPAKLFSISEFPDWKIWFFTKLSDCNSWKEYLASNAIPIVFMMLLVYCFIAYKRFEFDLSGATDIPFEIKKIQGINYEHLTFLATYIIPLISFDFGSERHMVVLVLLLVVMGAIYIKTDLFYANPSLALLGFHIYKSDGNFKTGDRPDIILISKDKLVLNQKVSYIKLDERIYYVKGTAQ